MRRAHVKTVYPASYQQMSQILKEGLSDVGQITVVKRCDDFRLMIKKSRGFLSY